MVFAIRGDIAGAMSSAFQLNEQADGADLQPRVLGVHDRDLHQRRARRRASACARCTCCRRSATSSASASSWSRRIPTAPVASIFDDTGTTLLYAGFFVMGLSQGLVEGVINPLVATIYSDQKTKRLNMLHAWWPGGMVIGGLLAVAMTQALNASWQLKLSTILIPAAIYLVMALSLHVSADRARGVERLHRRDVGRGRQAAVPPALRLHVDDGGGRARPRSVVPDRHGRSSCRSCRACSSSSTPPG